MSFDLKRFLKRIPAVSLRAYFAARRPELAAATKWSLTASPLADAVLAAMETLPSLQGQTIHSELERVAQFESDANRQSLRLVCKDRPDLIEAFERLPGAESCALHLLCVDPDRFEHASAVHYASRRRHGRDWTGLELLGSGPLKLLQSQGAVQAFAEMLRDVFRADGIGRPLLKVERYDVPNEGHDEDRADSEQVQFTIYIEDLPETRRVFGEDLEILHAPPQRFLVEAAVVVDTKTRQLDITAKRKDLRLGMAEAFLATMVAERGATQVRPRRRLRLDLLKKQPVFPLLPGDRVKRVGVETLWLAAPDSGGGLVMIERKVKPEGEDDLYGQADRWFGRRGLPGRPGWSVTGATIRVVFEPEGKSRREKSVGVELKLPDGSNLRDQTRYHRLIAETLLERWGLYEGKPG